MRTNCRFIVTTSCCLALLAASCTQQQPDTRAADERAIREADSTWSAAVAAKDLDRTLFYYAPDASYFAPNTPIITGLDAIRKICIEDFARPGYALSWKTAKVEVSRGGDLGYTFGTYEFTFNDANSKPVTDHGKYLLVWKKQSDGKWKAAADIFNSDLPTTPPPSK